MSSSRCRSRSCRRCSTEPFPNGNHNYWKSTFLPTLTTTRSTSIEHGNDGPSPLSASLVELYGGAGTGRAAEDGVRPAQAEYNIGIPAQWTDPAETDRHTAWTRAVTRR